MAGLPDSVIQAETERLLRHDSGRRARGGVVVCGETVRFEIRAFDARSAAQCAEDERRGRPAGNIVVLVPGHGQTVDGPRRLMATAAVLARSRLAWCIDPVPTWGGDCTEAAAIAAIVRDKMEAMFPRGPAGGEPARATLIGWSHGGSEALRAAAGDPELFPQFLGLCPTGLTGRRVGELVWSFVGEAGRCLLRAARRGGRHSLANALRLGVDMGIGLARDLRRGRSLFKLLGDVGCAADRVCGPAFAYPGQVAVVWSRLDSVVRWRDALPGCAGPEDLPAALPGFCRENFPRAGRVDLMIVEGDHVAPEAYPAAFLRPGLEALGELR